MSVVRLEVINVVLGQLTNYQQRSISSGQLQQGSHWAGLDVIVDWIFYQIVFRFNLIFITSNIAVFVLLALKLSLSSKL